MSDAPTLSPEQIEALADRLDGARLNNAATNKITDEHPELTYADAYAIQAALRARALARGEQIVGLKMGLTSLAKMKQMGVDSPICGFLTDVMQADAGSVIDCSDLIHPRIEPELAFVMKDDLRGPGCHVGDVFAATDFVLAALEIIDSRYENFRFDLVSVVADNTSASRYVIGGVPLDPRAVDLRTVGFVLEKNGVVEQLGAGAAILGNPAASVAALANMLARRDEYVPAGSTVLVGAATAAIAVAPGDAVNLRVQHIGSLGVAFG